VDFVIDQLLIRQSASFRYWRKKTSSTVSVIIYYVYSSADERISLHFQVNVSVIEAVIAAITAMMPLLAVSATVPATCTCSQIK
jgi:hypothetical protein